MGQSESTGGGRCGLLKEAAESAGLNLWGGSGAGLVGGEDWAWVGSGSGWKSRPAGTRAGDALGPRQVRRAGAAGFSAGVLGSAVPGPLAAEAWALPSRHGQLRRNSGQARGRWAASPASPGGLGVRGAARGRGRGGAGGTELGLPGGCVSGDRRLATIALLPARDPHAF